MLQSFWLVTFCTNSKLQGSFPSEAQKYYSINPSTPREIKRTGVPPSLITEKTLRPKCPQEEITCSPPQVPKTRQQAGAVTSPLPERFPPPATGNWYHNNPQGWVSRAAGQLLSAQSRWGLNGSSVHRGQAGGQKGEERSRLCPLREECGSQNSPIVRWSSVHPCEFNSVQLPINFLQWLYITRRGEKKRSHQAWNSEQMQPCIAQQWGSFDM